MMRRCCLVLCLVHFLSVAMAESAQALPGWMATLLHARAPSTHTAMWVADLRDSKPLYVYHAHHSMLPASTQKFLTALAAWRDLGSMWHFTTDLFAYGVQKKTILRGDVVLRLSGDPTLTSEDVLSLLQHLKARKIQRIDGTLWLDARMFTKQPYPKGVMWDDMTECYAVPQTAAILDQNCLQFTMDMQPRYASPKVHVIPKGIITLHKRMHVSSDPCALDVVAAPHNVYTMQGCVAPTSRRWTRQVAVADVRHYWQQRMRHFLKALGVRCRHIRWGRPPHKHRVLLQHWHHDSDNLPTLLAHMLKHSDNLMANSLFLSMGQHHHGAGVTWAQAQDIVRHILPFVTPKDTLVDGSGLSMYNRIDVATLGEALRQGHHDPVLFQQMRNGLAVAGVDGTLAHRFEQSPVRQHFFGKTGTLSGTTGLMGYLKTAKGHWLAVVVLSQGAVGDRQTFRDWEEQWVTALYDHV